VPQNYGKLGNWVKHQRHSYKKGKLAADRVAKLEELGFQWNVFVDWDKMFGELVEYHRVNRHCNVPRSNPQLGRWVTKQRELRKTKKLAADRIAKLDSLGFQWNVLVDWDVRFGELVDYHRMNRHCNVPYKYGPNPQLGEWVNKQRQRVKTKKLAADRIAKLDSLGFQWNVLVDWDVRFGELVDYLRVNRHCNVPRSYEPNPQLGRWVDTQRQLRKKGKLAADRIAKLDSLGFQWSAARGGARR
jgi:hypothetical protein